MDRLQAGDPSQVGPFRLMGRLGEGGMGRVYLGTSPGGRKVAIKVMHPHYANDPDFRRRFGREVGSARQVGGFHTAAVVDADPDADPPWMATAYIPGPSLAEAIARRGPLDEAGARELGAALAEGLAAIHGCGLIHRDLKPGNIILADDGPRIIDFGIAKGADTTALTGSHAVIGTLRYMSPEQLNGRELTPQSDVFALGTILVFAATGHDPFDGPAISAVMYHILNDPPNLDPLTGDLRDIASACLAKDPGSRPSPSDLLARFNPPEAPHDPAMTAAVAPLPLSVSSLGPPSADASDQARLADQELAPGSTVSVAIDVPGPPAKLPAARTGDAAAPARKPQHRNHRRRALIAGGTTAMVALAAGLGVLLLDKQPASTPSVTGTHSASAPATSPAPGGSPAPAPVQVVPLTAASRLAPLGGYVYVDYHDGSGSTAKISGRVRDPVNGEVARLYAQQFPYATAPVPAGSDILGTAGSPGAYAFEVTPTLATRYQVKLFKSAATTAPMATSATTTIYVVAIPVFMYRSGCTTRPVCHLKEIHTVYVPPSALSAEMSKPWLGYLGLNLLPPGDGVPAGPTVLKLGAGDPAFAQPALIATGEFSVTTYYTFTIGAGGYHFYSTVCAKSTRRGTGSDFPVPMAVATQALPPPSPTWANPAAA